MSYTSRKQQKAFTKTIPWKLGLCLISVLSLFVFVRYSHRYGFIFRLMTVATFILMLLAPVFFQATYLSIKGDKWWQKIANGLVMLLIIIPMLIGAFALQTFYKNYQLNHYGRMAQATVTGFEEEHHKHSVSYYATFQFTFEGKEYTQKVSNDDGYYNMNDTLELLVSENDPEFFKITGTARTY